MFAKSGYVGYVPGLTNTPDRLPNVWSTLLNSTEVISAVSSTGLYVSSRYPPPGAKGSEDAGNSFMYENQRGVYRDTFNNGYENCPQYAPSTLSGSYTTNILDIDQSFSNYFADGVFYCEACTSYTPGDPPADLNVFYDGSLWVTDVVVSSSCYEQNCRKYPYGYMNYKSSKTSPDASYYSSSCPVGVENLQLDTSFYTGGLTALSMTWLNLLSNLVSDPQLQQYPIQVGISQYGNLDFEPNEVSQGEANVLTVIAILLMNGFWPTAVWRHSIERSQDIVLMMRTVGMRPESYLIGMFGFDMAISVVSGVAMVGFAVGLKLSRFDGAPIVYLVLIVVLSAFALNGGTLLLVRLLGKHSSLLPLIAPCVLIAATAGVSLTNILVYPDDGEWPWTLSIIPFFAQV